jgi:hypothetical protein
MTDDVTAADYARLAEDVSRVLEHRDLPRGFKNLPTDKILALRHAANIVLAHGEFPREDLLRAVLTLAERELAKRGAL